MLPSAVKFQISFFIFLLDFTRIQYIYGAKSLRGYTCPIGQFTCDSGHCIDELKLCDGTGDCNDNSDETIRVCNLEPCPNSTFTCKYGACIHKNGRCNGVIDCVDGSDETCGLDIKPPFLKGCKLPNNPLHGKYVVLNHLSVGYIPGDVVSAFGVLSVNCNKGYIANPSEYGDLSYCLPTSEWMPVPKTCVRKSLFSAGCRVPSNPSHGKYVVINHVSAGYKPGNIAPVFSLMTVNCNSGYVINSLENSWPSYCLPTEEWSPPPHTCEVMPLPSEGCRFPNNLLEGEYEVKNDKDKNDKYNPGDIVPVNKLLSLKCNEGYKISSSTDYKLSKCQSPGKWVPPLKICVQGCRLPDNPLNGKYLVENDEGENDVYYSGDIVSWDKVLSVNCNKGYEVSPLTNDSKPSQCRSTGIWDPAPRTCLQGCRLPDNPLNGEYVVENFEDENAKYNPGDIVPVHKSLSVSCKIGYQVSPPTVDESSKCTSAGEWIPSPKTCSLGCRLPDNPLNGEYVVEYYDEDDFTEYNPGDTVPVHQSLYVSCNEGYEVSPSTDDELSNCTSTGKWFPALKTCVRSSFENKGCQIPDDPLNGKYVIDESDDEYDDESPPNYPRDVPIHSSLSVNCNEGYEVSPSEDDKLSYCTSSGKWIPAPNTCVRSSVDSKGCRVPNGLSHGNYIITYNLSSVYNPGDVVPVESVLSPNCTMGYSSNPPNLSVCKLNGKWIPKPKTCTRVCPSLVPTNTTYIVCEFDGQPLYTCSNPIENTVARLLCAPYYEEANMEKYPTRLCKDGSWKYPIPQCYPICGKLDSLDYFNNKVGKEEIKRYFPWHVNIYTNDVRQQKRYVCGGFIIKEQVVMSAASCFIDDQGNQYEKEDFVIAASKYYDSYNDSRDINPQYSRVDAIYIPEDFKGKNHYQPDVVLIKLSTPFKLTAKVQPICIDLETVQDEKSNDYDKVTELNAMPGYLENKLLELFPADNFSVLPYNKCLEILYGESKKHIADDKICAKYIKMDFSVCTRPIGSALAYLNETTNRYFIGGIASTDKLSNCVQLLKLQLFQ